jgi:hypothetical protein
MKTDIATAMIVVGAILLADVAVDGMSAPPGLRLVRCSHVSSLIASCIIGHCAQYGRQTTTGTRTARQAPLSGEVVTVDSALRSTPFSPAWCVIAETMGYVPWFVYRRRPDGGRERAWSTRSMRNCTIQPNLGRPPSSGKR